MPVLREPLSIYLPPFFKEVKTRAVQQGVTLKERTGLSTNKKAVIQKARKQERQQDFTDLIRDPYVLEFTGLAERPEYLESDLESALLTHLQSFLLELGAGFCFEARQKRITVGKTHDYIDLVFHHRRFLEADCERIESQMPSPTARKRIPRKPKS